MNTSVIRYLLGYILKLEGFLLLALPDDHPFWSAEAAPLPVELTRAGVTGQPSADLLLQRLPDGQLNAYSPANYEKGDHGQFVEKYGKFVYNTRFGFSASRSYVQLEQAAPDSMLAFVIDGWTFVRRHSDRFVLMGDRLLSEWRPFPGIKVTTELVPTKWGHVRNHTVESTIACTAYDCGFAVPKFAVGFAAAANGTGAEAHNDTCRCTVQGRGLGDDRRFGHAADQPAVHIPVKQGKMQFVCHTSASPLLKKGLLKNNRRPPGLGGASVRPGESLPLLIRLISVPSRPCQPVR